MRTITNDEEVQRLRSLVAEMTELEIEIRLDWARRTGWTVVPTESGARIPPPYIQRIVPTLAATGVAECFALVTEDLGDMPTCYAVPMTETGFNDVNRELGMFRFILTDQSRSWAISCNEWYNLFAGPRQIVEAMLGKTVEGARSEYKNFAQALARGDREYPLLKVSERYSAT